MGTVEYANEDMRNFRQLKWLQKFLIGHSGFIAGGFARAIFTDAMVKDLDMFFSNTEEHAKAVLWYNDLCAGSECNATMQWFHAYENDNVVAFKYQGSPNARPILVELNRKIFGGPAFILDNFDFTVAKFAVRRREVDIIINGQNTHTDEYRAIYHPKFFEHVYLKRTVIDDKIPYPISTYDRMLRYAAKYGFAPCMGTKVKLLKALQDLPAMGDDDKISRSMYDGID